MSETASKTATAILQEQPLPFFGSDDEIERDCLRHIAELQGEYHERAAPFVRVITEIRNRRTVRIFIPG